jgi:hypothetical protein
MSATDDASHEDSRRPHAAQAIALATVAGAVLGALAALALPPGDVALFESRLAWVGAMPAPEELPDALRPGERMRLERTPEGSELVVSAARSERARELAAALATRRSESLRPLLEARDTLASLWSADPAASSAPAHGSPRNAARASVAPDAAARCASWLLAGAQARRALVSGVPAPWATPDDATLPAPAIALDDARRDVAAAVDRRDDAALARALAGEAAREDDWFASGAPASEGSLRRRAAVWRVWQLARAESLEAMASRLLASEPPAQQRLASAGVAPALTALALRSPRPYESLLRTLTPAWTPSASPIVPAWRRWLAFGALLGALAAAALAWLATRLPPRRDRSPLPATLRDPGATSAWLHVVTGPSSGAIARAVVELAAHALARGERVLVVDGGTTLRLHERFGREARWGLMECLLADMPVIGLMQYGGRPGFYLLAHGNPERSEGWAAIGRRLDDARPHFGRIVLALDASAPRALGDALGGRALEGWWAAATPRLPAAAIAAMERLGIAFSGMDLSVVPHATLEVLAGRSRGLALLAPPRPALPEPVASVPPEPAPPSPVVLDCDLQIRQRLRFLAWMRRVQAERRELETGAIR